MSDFKVTNFAPERGHDVFVGRVAQGAAGSGQVLVSDGVTEVDAIRIQFTGAGVTENPDNVAQVTIGTGIRTLLNNSGGDVGIYQVVVSDPTADDAFTTTTSAQVTQRGIGVTQAAIAAGESGPVMFSGETPVAVTGTVVRGDFLETSTTAGKATTNATRRAGSFAVLLEGADPSDLTLALDGILIDSAVTRENTPGTSLTADYPATVPDGMAMFLALWLDSGGSTPTVTGWTRIGSTSGFRYYQRDSDSSLAGGTLAISWTGSSRSVATILVLDRLALASLVAGFAYDSTSAAAAISGLTSAQYLALAAVEAPAADVDGWTTLANENLPGDLIDVISDTSWKALRLNSDAGPINSEPAGWEDAGFDDSAWLAVDSESFAGRPAIDSALLVGPGNITVWSGLDWISRKEFTLASDALSDATLSWLVDITGHVYLDGTEIASLTTVNVNNFGTVHTVTVPAASLTTGTHCLGVRVHNDSGGANWNANPSHFKLQLSGGAATVAGALVMKGFSGTGITSPYSGSALAKDAIFALTLAVDSLLSLPVARALLWGGDADLGIEEISTSETDTTKVLRPDGSGYMAWGAETAVPAFATPSIAYGTPAGGAASTVIRSDATIAKPTAADVDFSADVTTNNVTTGHHGLTPKLPNDATKYLDGTGAYSVPAGGGGGFVLTGGSATTLYVNASTGNDTTGNGTSGTPYASITRALEDIPTIIDRSYTITVADGTYREQVNIDRFVFLDYLNGVTDARIILTGNTTTPTNCVISGADSGAPTTAVRTMCIWVRNGARVVIAGFSLQYATARGLQADYYSVVSLGKMDYQHGDGMLIGLHSLVVLTGNQVIGTAGTGILVNEFGRLNTDAGSRSITMTGITLRGLYVIEATTLLNSGDSISITAAASGTRTAGIEVDGNSIVDVPVTLTVSGGFVNSLVAVAGGRIHIAPGSASISGASGATYFADDGGTIWDNTNSIQLASDTPTTLHGCVAKRTTNLLITAGGALAAIAMDGEDFDSDNYHDNSTNNTRITVPAGKAGKYRLDFSCTNAPSAGCQLFAGFKKNGSSFVGAEGGTKYPNTGDQLFTMTAPIVALAAGDYIEVFVQAVTANTTIYGTGTYPMQFALTFLGL